jgi:hypothetical protein
LEQQKIHHAGRRTVQDIMPETITDHGRDSSLSTPDIPASAAVFAIHATTRISAPAALVFRTLRNTDTWRDWNKFCPRVNMTSQPAEGEDEATLLEIQQLVRNTSVAGSVDSAITDGAATQGGGLIGRRMSIEEEDKIRHSPPPVTKVRLRSIAASQHSVGSNAGERAGSTSGDDPAALAALAVANVHAASGLGVNGASQGHARSMSGASQNSGTTGAKDFARPSDENLSPPLSAAQKFQQSHEQRKASVTSGERPDTPKNVLVEAPHDPNVLVPAPRTPTGEEASKASKRKSVSAATRRRLSINALYGEPSVRVQIGTRMDLHLMRRVIKGSLATDREMSVVVNEVSRPEDNEEAGLGMLGNSNGNKTGIEFVLSGLENGALDGADSDGSTGARRISRMMTHIAAKQPGVYRIVWTMAEKYSPPKSYPRWLLMGQRVHEIRKVTRGDGKEECVYEDWECWKGMLANKTAKKNKVYWEERAKEWGLGLGAYCEAMGGDVERRDFVG